MTGSTVSRRAFGNFMRELRERVGKTLLAAGLEAETSRMTIQRLEDGWGTKVSTMQLRSLLDFYEVDDQNRVEALSLWEEVKEQAKVERLQGTSKGFWKSYTDQIAPNFPKFLRLESAAESIITYQPTIIPGLLQTPDYRRTIILINEPDLSAVDLERRLELTQQRKSRLNGNGFQLEAFVSEAVLRHQPGGTHVMAAQLQLLAEIGERDAIGIRVVPFYAGAHRGLTMQGFSLLRFPDSTHGMPLPAVVFAEGALGSTFHEHEDEVNEYQQAIDNLRAVALTEEGSRDLMSRVAKEYAA
ncbi:helix-turn-helix domain-containing protein [Nocardia sp. SYP-A9097]|uniref:helix-turn-helix domain-containing protein n=1 Tax=Nocardia sp. SYP-A9097 TaxID=2663237 RepID=UPI00129BF3C1|nr:helix-turn-helix transcriptional regulator [Nocardia sp. SYP-A9097]MRH93195.1 helix-turn-helix domain-containing protein [Nocardia sp. SYP-A9097]